MKAPEHIETSRLLLRKPIAADAEAIYNRYSTDPEVTRYVGWPSHQSLEQTKEFLAFSEAEWNRWPAGPYLIEHLGNHELLGSTGFTFEAPTVAVTGYVLARDAWGRGYATEALAAMVVVARNVGVRQLVALCHPAHRASIRVLEKCGFLRKDLLTAFANFPNLDSSRREDCLRFTRTFTSDSVGHQTSP